MKVVRALSPDYLEQLSGNLFLTVGRCVFLDKWAVKVIGICQIFTFSPMGHFSEYWGVGLMSHWNDGESAHWLPISDRIVLPFGCLP